MFTVNGRVCFDVGDIVWDNVRLCRARVTQVWDDRTWYLVEYENGEHLSVSEYEVAAAPSCEAKDHERPADWRMYYDNSSSRRKDQPVTEGFLDYFPAAVRLCAELSRLGNEKHNPGEPLHHARGKSKDHRNCAVRHLMDADTADPETNLVEAVAAFWRLGAYIQELCETTYGWPKAPAAKE